MSARIYTVEFHATAVTAAVDAFEVGPADDKPCEIIGLFLSQHSDVGDAQDELLPYSIVRGNATSGTGGSQAVTPQPVNPGDAAAAFTADTLNTAAASAGTAVTVFSNAFNVRAGEALWLPEGCEIKTVQGSLLVVRLLAAPADPLTMNGTLWVREQ
jgi:hypothetical protein